MLQCIFLISSEPYTIYSPCGHTNVSPEIINSSELILWRLIPKASIQKIKMQEWLSYFFHEEEDDHNHKDEKKERGTETDTRWNLKRHISLVSL